MYSDIRRRDKVQNIRTETRFSVAQSKLEVVRPARLIASAASTVSRADD